MDDMIPTITFEFAIVAHSFKQDPHRIFTGITFSKDVQVMKTKSKEPILNLEIKLISPPIKDLTVERVAVFFPSHSPNDQEFFQLINNEGVWSSKILFEVSKDNMPLAFKFSLRAQYQLNGKKLCETLDPIVIVGEDDQGGELNIWARIK